MEAAPDSRKRVVHSLREQFERDGPLECLGIDVVGEGFVHGAGAFAKVVTVRVTDHAIETKCLGTGRLRTDMLHDTDSSLGLLHAGRCADEGRGMTVLAALARLYWKSGCTTTCTTTRSKRY